MNNIVQFPTKIQNENKILQLKLYKQIKRILKIMEALGYDKSENNRVTKCCTTKEKDTNKE